MERRWQPLLYDYGHIDNEDSKYGRTFAWMDDLRYQAPGVADHADGNDRVARGNTTITTTTVGQASVGMDYLLPALVGAFLGSTTIRPGRVNVWGTVVGIAVLAIGIAGIQQFGGAFWVEPLFNGATLLLSITLAGYAQRRRALNKKLVQRAQTTAPGSSVTQ